MHSNLKYSLKHLKKKRPLKQVMRQQIPYQVAHRAHLPVSYLVLSSQYLVTSPGFFFSFSFLKSCSNSMISFPPPLCFYSCFFNFLLPSPLIQCGRVFQIPQAAIKQQGWIWDSAWFPSTRNIMEINFVPRIKNSLALVPLKAEGKKEFQSKGNSENWI